jgi:hypothetical protein
VALAQQPRGQLLFLAYPKLRMYNRSLLKKKKKECIIEVKGTLLLVKLQLDGISQVLTWPIGPILTMF